MSVENIEDPRRRQDDSNLMMHSLPTIMRRSSRHVNIEESERSALSLFIDQQEKNCPRTFNLIFFMIVPLMLLIFNSMFFGHFLAQLESPGELEFNNQLVASAFRESARVNEVIEEAKRSYDDCIDEFINIHKFSEATIIGNELKIHIEYCTSGRLKEVEKLKEKIDEEIDDELVMNKMHFNWNTCSEDGSKTHAYKQGKFVHLQWIESRNKLYEQNIANDAENAYNISIEKATGADNCVVNSAGGAMFWFTIMTTIGYGNAAPETRAGQALVGVMGLFSILAFTAVAGAAGYVTLTIVDDMFKRLKMERMTKGFHAIVFWLFVLLLSMLLIAGIRSAYTRDRIDNDTTRTQSEVLLDQFWFAFISITTVGFGDFFIPHDKFQQHDMFYIPFVMLFGFVCLANFLIKLTEMTIEWVKSTGITDDESLSFLLGEERKNLSLRASVHLDGDVFIDALSNEEGADLIVDTRTSFEKDQKKELDIAMGECSPTSMETSSRVEEEEEDKMDDNIDTNPEEGVSSPGRVENGNGNKVSSFSRSSLIKTVTWRGTVGV